MLQALRDWIFGRALHISAAGVRGLAKRTGQNAERIRAINTAVAGIVADKAVAAVCSALPGAPDCAKGGGNDSGQ